jgi:hypothetical protein
MLLIKGSRGMAMENVIAELKMLMQEKRIQNTGVKIQKELL